MAFILNHRLKLHLIRLDISITNITTLTGLLTNADITTFGFGVNPNATASFVTGGEGVIFDMLGVGSGHQQKISWEG